MIGWIVFLAWLEFYSVGITLLAKRRGSPRYGICMIPFASFFYVDSFTEGFFILTVPVKKWGKTVLIFCGVVILAQLGCVWADSALTAEMAGYFKQIMMLPVGFCLLVYWLGTIKSTSKMLDILKTNFKGAWILSALLIPIPALLLRKGSVQKQKTI